MTVRRLVPAAVLGLAASLLWAAPSARAISPDVLISEVYGGGGNAGATLTNDFIELGNRDAASVPLDGWSVQYLPASPSAASLWQVTPLTGALPSNGSYLVQEAQGAGGTTPLPTPDATGTIAMSATAGTVALVNTTERLTCKTAADCAVDPRIRDLVGYGTAVVREISPAPTATNTTSVFRPSLSDTDNNAVDFVSGTPTPKSLPEPPPPATPAAIHDIQGTTHLSPLQGTEVETSGIVTAVRPFGSARGFWMQNPTPDSDAATSEGIFVFTGSTTPTVASGDAVTVIGTVTEFYPDGSPATAVNLSTTELTGATWVVDSAGNALPAAEELSAITVPVAFTPEPGGTIEALTLQPTQYAVDFFESREGMRVQVNDAPVVGPTSAFNEVFVSSVKPTQNPTARGGTRYSGYDQQNSGRLLIESLIPFAQRPFPRVDVGDVLTGVTAGPVDYSRFGGYRLLATELGGVQDNGLARETTRRQRDNELAVATYNVENLDPGDPVSKFERLAAGIVTHLNSPDIVALEEIQDNSGPVDDGTVAADATLDRLTDHIAAAGGPAYEWRQIDPLDLADGGQPGGNIRVGFLFNPERTTFVDRPGGDATTAVDVVAGPDHKPQLTVSPGRIDPGSDAWEASRKPLVGEFRFNDKTVFVVANHFSSKGGDQPLHGRFQPPNRSSEAQRVQQAQEVRQFVDEVHAVDPRAGVVVLGDINDFEFSPTVQALTSGGALTDLMTTLAPAERYTYVFQGNSQTLDHILIGGRWKSVDYDVVHINAEFHDQASDHDPQVARLKPGK